MGALENCAIRSDDIYLALGNFWLEEIFSLRENIWCVLRGLFSLGFWDTAVFLESRGSVS